YNHNISKSLLENKDLFEARKDDYMKMLPTVLQNIENTSGKTWKDKWADEVNWALNTLKKQDRITWYLRFIRASFAKYLLELSGLPEKDPEIKKACEKAINDIVKISGPQIKNQLNISATSIQNNL